MIKVTRKQKKLIGKNIRDAMDKAFPGKGRGRRVANLLGVSPSMVSQWANGKKTPSILHLYRMAKIFGIPLHKLCGLPKQKNIRAKYLAATIIKRLAGGTGKKNQTWLEKIPHTDVKIAISLINKELDDLKKHSTDDA